MKHKILLKTVLAALFAALSCIFTMIIQVPSPMSGYVNLGDCMVLTSGWILGGSYGFLAAGIGSMLADIFTSYAHYAIGTFLIKGIMAVLAAVLFRVFVASIKSSLLSRILSAVIAEAFMVLGYFFYAGLFLGKGVAAATSIPGNLVQGVIGAVAGILLTTLLLRVKNFKSLIDIK